MTTNMGGVGGGVIAKRVLVVDDYPDAAEITCVLLRIIGHDARAAYRGDAALELAESFAPEIAIVDLVLPDMSGIDVGRELRARSRRDLHLAALTGWTDPALRERACAAGFDQFVIKPTTRAVLETLIRKAGGAVRARLSRPGGPVACPSTAF